MKRKDCVMVVLLALASLICIPEVLAQDKGEQPCASATTRTSGRYVFRKQWESFEVPILDESPGLENCQAVALELHWSNGRSNGSNFNVIFLDATNRPIYKRQLSGFRVGNFDIPLTPAPNAESRPWLGTPWMMAIPASITIQAVPPFAAPSTIFYSLVRAPRTSRLKSKAEEPRKPQVEKQANEIVQIRSVVRLVGATRIPLVQMELKTSHPFPVREAALHLRIGKKVFMDELSGDYTGRRLTLSLTTGMFEELEDGAEVVAFFEKSDDVWSFGNLDKKKLER